MTILVNGEEVVHDGAEDAILQQMVQRLERVATWTGGVYIAIVVQVVWEEEPLSVFSSTDVVWKDMDEPVEIGSFGFDG